MSALAFREPDEFEVVPLRVPVVKRPDACHRREIVWQGLRPCAYVPDVMSAQCGIGHIHIADNDGEVLKPQVVAAAIRRNGAASWRRNELSELNLLLPNSQSDDSHPRAEDPGEFLARLAQHFTIIDDFKGQDLGVECKHPIQIRDGKTNTLYLLNHDVSSSCRQTRTELGTDAPNGQTNPIEACHRGDIECPPIVVTPRKVMRVFRESQQAQLFTFG